MRLAGDARQAELSVVNARTAGTSSGHVPLPGCPHQRWGGGGGLGLPGHSSPCASASGSSHTGPRRKSRLPACPSGCSPGPASDGGASWGRQLCLCQSPPASLLMSAPSAEEAGTRPRSTGQVRAGGPAGLQAGGSVTRGGSVARGCSVPRGGSCAQGGREPARQGAWNPATPVVRVGRASRTPFQGGKLRPSGQDPFGRQPPAQAPSALLLRGGWEPLEMLARRPPQPPRVRICISPLGRSPAELR